MNLACGPLTNDCVFSLASRCVIYDGPNTSNIGYTSNMRLTDLLLLIDAKIATIGVAPNLQAVTNIGNRTTNGLIVTDDILEDKSVTSCIQIMFDPDTLPLKGGTIKVQDVDDVGGLGTLQLYASEIFIGATVNGITEPLFDNSDKLASTAFVTNMLPFGPAKSLQLVTDVGNFTDNVIQITGSDNFDPALESLIFTYAPGIGSSIFTYEPVTGEIYGRLLIKNTSFDIDSPGLAGVGKPLNISSSGTGGEVNIGAETIGMSSVDLSFTTTNPITSTNSIIAPSYIIDDGSPIGFIREHGLGGLEIGADAGLASRITAGNGANYFQVLSTSGAFNMSSPPLGDNTLDVLLFDTTVGSPSAINVKRLPISSLIGMIPTLQQVTTAGNTSTNSIIINPTTATSGGLFINNTGAFPGAARVDLVHDTFNTTRIFARAGDSGIQMINTGISAFSMNGSTSSTMTIDGGTCLLVLGSLSSTSTFRYGSNTGLAIQNNSAVETNRIFPDGRMSGAASTNPNEFVIQSQLTATAVTIIATSLASTAITQAYMNTNHASVPIGNSVWFTNLSDDATKVLVVNKLTSTTWSANADTKLT